MQELGIYKSNGRFQPKYPRPSHNIRADSKAAVSWRKSPVEMGFVAVKTVTFQIPQLDFDRNLLAPDCAMLQRPIRILLVEACR